jgi:hypothetical protein
MAAQSEAEALRSEAAQDAQQLRHHADVRSRELIAEARAATREVLRDGEILSGHLRELSDSLRINAERLLRDVRDAHAELSARLDRADPDRTRSRTRSPDPSPLSPPASPEPEIPEFIPPTGR